MRYHPDRNADPRAAEAFILVNEAYEYLSDTKRRTSHSTSRTSRTTGRARDEEMRRSRRQSWDEHQREAARQRAARYANASVEDFKKSPLYRAAMVMDSFYNYIFLLVGVIIIIGPFYGLTLMDPVEREEYNYFQLIVPVVLGVGFIYGLWYFIFKVNEEED